LTPENTPDLWKYVAIAIDGVSKAPLTLCRQQGRLNTANVIPSAAFELVAHHREWLAMTLQCLGKLKTMSVGRTEQKDKFVCRWTSGLD
jgi:hypothetical protein